MKLKSVTLQRDSHIVTLRLIIGLMLIVTFLMWLGWKSAPANLRIHVPPDLSRGYTAKIDKIPKAAVYSFAYYIFQQLNTWDGTEKSYFNRIYALQGYFSESFLANRYADNAIRQNKGELNRVRRILESNLVGYVDSRVEVETSHSWVVYMDLNVLESINGVNIKNLVIRYKLKIIKSDHNPAVNPWGFVIDGYADKPQKLQVKLIANGERK